MERLPQSLPRATRLLIVDRDEWGARSLESILKPNGYSVLLAHTGREALDHLEQERVDIVLLSFTVPDVDGVVLCAAIRDMPVHGGPRPIVVLSATNLSRGRRLAALRAGAWAILPPRFDSEELIVQLETFREAKRYADRATGLGLLDLELGCYNASGLRHRLGELLSESARREHPIACIVLHISGEGPFDIPSTDLLRILAARLGHHLRKEDVLGRLDRDHLVIAVGVEDEAAAADVQRRLTAELQQVIAASDSAGELMIHGGLRVTGRGEQLSPVELVRSARKLAERMGGHGDATNGQPPA